MQTNHNSQWDHPDAVDRFVREYSPWMLRVAKGIVRSEHNAEEVVQEVWLKEPWLKIQHDLFGMSAKSFLLWAVENTAKDWLKKEQQCQPVAGKGWFKNPLRGDEFPERWFDGQHWTEHVRTVVGNDQSVATDALLSDERYRRKPRKTARDVTSPGDRGEPEGGHGEPAGGNGEPEDPSSEGTLRERQLRALIVERLGDELGNILIWLTMDNETTNEVADRLGIEPYTVNRRRAKALKIAREELAEMLSTGH